MCERPLILVVLESHVQSNRGLPYCNADTRNAETINALHCMWPDGVGIGGPSGDGHVRFMGYRDDAPPGVEALTEILATTIMKQRESVTNIWAPAYEEGGHDQHNLVALACNSFEGTCNVHRYLTYTRAGGKSRGWADGRHQFYGRRDRPCGICDAPDHSEIHKPFAVEVFPRSADDIQRKLRAMSCYRSQMQMDPRLGCAEWFYGNDLREYVLPPASAGENRS